MHSLHVSDWGFCPVKPGRSKCQMTPSHFTKKRKKIFKALYQHPKALDARKGKQFRRPRPPLHSWALKLSGHVRPTYVSLSPNSTSDWEICPQDLGISGVLTASSLVDLKLARQSWWTININQHISRFGHIQFYYTNSEYNWHYPLIIISRYYSQFYSLNYPILNCFL